MALREAMRVRTSGELPRVAARVATRAMTAHPIRAIVRVEKNEAAQRNAARLRYDAGIRT